MIGPDSVLCRATDLRYRAVDDETVVIRQQSAEALVLNEVAGRILDLIDGRRTVNEVVDRLLEEYEVERPRLLTDVTGYLGELLESGLVVPAAAAGGDATPDASQDIS